MQYLAISQIFHLTVSHVCRKRKLNQAEAESDFVNAVVGEPLNIEKRGKRGGGGDGNSGEIKRVENFFSSSSPLPATPGITCPVLNITRESEGQSAA